MKLKINDLLKFSNKIFHHDKGVSLIMALAALGMLSLGSYYVMVVGKNDKNQFKNVEQSRYLENERKRISSALSDVRTCRANFLGKAITAGTPADAITPNNIYGINNVSPYAANPAIKILSNDPAIFYFNKTLKIKQIKLGIDLEEESVTNSSKKFQLVLTYEKYTGDVAHLTQTSTGIKKNGSGDLPSVAIPMFVSLVGGVVADCYAIAEKSNLENAINASCTPTGSTAALASIHNSLTNSAGSGTNFVNGCDRTVTWENKHTDTNPKTNYSSCFVTNAGTATQSSKLFNSISMNTNGTMELTEAGNCGSITTSPCPAGQAVFGMSGSIVQCDDGGRTHDVTSCTSGQFLTKDGTATPICKTIACTLPAMIESISSSGVVSCYTQPGRSCAAGEYIDTMGANQAFTCKPLPINTQTCAPGSFGSSITRAAATATLNCLAYNKAKSCAGAANNVFVNTFNNSGVNCSSYP